MVLRSLCSLVRGSMRGRSCTSSPGIAVKGALGSAAWREADAPHSLRNAFFHAGRRNDLLAAAALRSPFTGSRRLYSRVAYKTAPHETAPHETAPRFHILRKLVIKHADAAFATLSVAVFSVVAGILHTYDELDEAPKEGTPMRTSRYLRSHQMLAEVRQERASYHKTIPNKKAVVQEYMEEEDKAMKARFEEWMKKYGRTYKDELEKARRFKIFKAAARCADAYNADAAKAGHSARFGLNDFSDWNAQEIAPLHGTPTSRDGGYLRMIMHYLAEQEIWHQVSSVPILSMQ